MGFSPPQQRSLIPQCHIETALTFSFLKENGKEKKKSCVVRMQCFLSSSSFPGIEVRVFRILTYTGFIGLVMFHVFLALLDYFS